jgi:hypothetical protein
MIRHLSAFVCFLLFLPLALAREIEEKFPDGKVKLTYTVDDAGIKNGAYLENYENGKPKVKATYAGDELNGAYTSYFENGKTQRSATYKKGKLDGTYKEWSETGQVRLLATYQDGKLFGWRTEYDKEKIVSSHFIKDDEVLFPKSLEQIKTTLAEIQRSSEPKGSDPERESALRRLKAYRYLCDVPYDDLTLDDEYNKFALAGAKLCEKIGRIEHTPANPGLPKEEYDVGFTGTSHGNLASGQLSLMQAVDLWMNDSDKSNRERCGHRRWCLNPEMQKTGFGKSGKFSVMYSMDNKREKVPDYDFVSFPPRGYLPASFFKAAFMWSVSINLQKYTAAGEGTKVNVYLADKDYNKTGKPLELSYFKIDNGGFGSPSCIIFQPKVGSALAPRYWVEVEGVQTRDGKPVALHWVTEFAAQ